MATDTYTLEYVARIEKLQAELAKIPGATDKSALAAAQRLEARLDKASKQAGKAVESNIGGAFASIAKSAGYGDLVEKIGNLGKGLEGVAGGLGAAGIAAGGAAVGLAAVAAALYAAANASGALTQEQAAGNAVWREAIANLGELGAGPAKQATNTMTGLYYVVDATATSFRLARNTIVAMADTLSTDLLLAVGHAKAAWFDFDYTTTETQRQSIIEVKKWNEAWDGREGLTTAIGRAYDQTVRETQAIHEQTAAIDKSDAALKKWMDTNNVRIYGPKAETNIEQYRREQDEKKAAQAEAAKRAAKLAADEIKHQAELARWSDDLFRLNTNYADSIAAQKAEEWAKEQERQQGIADFLADIARLEANTAEQRRVEQADWNTVQQQMQDEEYKYQTQRKLDALAYADSVIQLGSVFSDLATSRMRDDKKAARAAFFIQKGLALSQVAVETAVASIAGFAASGPVGLALALATGAGAAAKILATPPPKFHQGGTQADEGLAVVRKGERVMTERGARDYDQGLGDVNRGAATGGGPVRVLFEGRDLDVMLARVVRQHGAVRRELDRRRMTGAY